MEEKEWFLYVVDHHEGPLSVAEIQKRIKNGEAKTTSYVWKEGYADWAMMSDVSEFGPGSGKSDSHGPSTFVPAPRPGVVVGGPDMSGVTASSSVWCLNSNKVFTGPHSMKIIVRRINDGEVGVQDSVWREGWSSFMTISGIPEFMQQVKPDVLQGGGKKAAKGAKGARMSSSAEALGIGGGPSVRAYRWYKSSKLFFLVLLASLVGLYHFLTIGRLDPVLERLSVREKVKALNLPLIPWDRGLSSGLSALAGARESALPLLQKGAAALPEPLKTWAAPLESWLSTVHLPEGLAPESARLLREAALSDPRNGPKAAIALSVGDEMNPSFVVASNAPGGTSLAVTLKGKEGTLLNAFTYEKTVSVALDRHVARTPRFAHDGDKPLPKGEYLVGVQDSDRQVSIVESFFLGGARDESYSARLREFNERIKARLAQEAGELKQVALTLESIANESATKFFGLAAAPASSQRRNAWRQYHARYAKISGQLAGMFRKYSSDPRRDDYVLGSLYQRFGQTYELTERLHQSESDFIERGGKMDAVRAQATQAADALNSLKEAIFKVIK